MGYFPNLKPLLDEKTFAKSYQKPQHLKHLEFTLHQDFLPDTLLFFVGQMQRGKIVFLHCDFFMICLTKRWNIIKFFKIFFIKTI